MLARRPLLTFAVAVLAGAAAARLWPETAWLAPFGWLAAAGLAAWLFLTPGRPDPEEAAGLPEGYERHILPRPGFFARRGLNRCLALAGLVFFLLGAERQFSWRAAAESGLGRLPDAEWMHAVFIALEPARVRPDDAGVWRVPARLIETWRDGEKRRQDLVVRLSGPAGEDFRRGDLINALVRREAIRPPLYPGAFDFPLWLERDGVFAAFSIANAKAGGGARRPPFRVTWLDSPPAAVWARRQVDAVRSWAVGRTLELAGARGGLLSAMLYGYRDDMDGELRDAFRRVGIGHVLAISGLHVGLVAGLLWWLSGWLYLSARVRAGGCLLLALFYLGLAGGQVAASRATLMLCIHLFGVIAGRRGDMLNSLGAAALALTLLNPSAPWDVSFQLSFTAMIFIHASLERVSGAAGRPGGSRPDLLSRLAGEARSLTRLSLATWLGLFPIIALVFNQVNLAGIPINILVIPLMSLVLAGGLLLPWLGWLPGVPGLLILPTDLLTESARLTDKLPYSSFPCHPPSGLAIFLFYLAMAIFLLRGLVRNRRIRRRWRNAALAGIALAFSVLLASLASAPPPPTGRIALLAGGGFGGLVAEAAAGGAAAIMAGGSRGGLDEAGWLHYQRRGGQIAVLAAGQARPEKWAALGYHFPIAEVTVLPTLDKTGAGRRRGWLAVPGAPGVDYAYRRDAAGRLIWLAVRTGENRVCLAPRLTPGRAEILRGDAAELGFNLLQLGCAGGWRGKEPPEFPGWAAYSGLAADFSRPGWFPRRQYRALRLEEEVLGFDGGAWRKVGD